MACNYTPTACQCCFPHWPVACRTRHSVAIIHTTTYSQHSLLTCRCSTYVLYRERQQALLKNLQQIADPPLFSIGSLSVCVCNLLAAPPSESAFLDIQRHQPNPSITTPSHKVGLLRASPQQTFASPYFTASCSPPSSLPPSYYLSSTWGHTTGALFLGTLLHFFLPPLSGSFTPITTQLRLSS